MWNRVVLLAAGVALGWNLVHALVAPFPRARRHRVWVLVAGAVGLGMSAALVPTGGVGAFLVGLLVLGLSAAVAYAANAREVGKAEEPLPRARPAPAASDPRPAVLLVAAGEPRTYTGPAPWAAARRREGGEGAPHWFLRPAAYARIRRAYARLAPEETVEGWVDGLGRRLDRALGDGYRVREAFLDIPPTPASALFHAAEDGHRTILLLPIGLPPDAIARLREEVARSRVVEVGVAVSYLASVGGEGALAAALGARLPALARGTAPPPLAPHTEAAVTEALARIAAWAARAP
jgi:hypothetical protein